MWNQPEPDTILAFDRIFQGCEPFPCTCGQVSSKVQGEWEHEQLPCVREVGGTPPMLPNVFTDAS
eukprot:9534319-Alexandrium_andersonii.AAC.1